ncbi:MAG: F0F1 ATP synthase subunit A [Verrucomicrobiota bacterium]|nr:F0F1 ATP synthase subunit A [Verrucomicrobiota bacterium]
MATAFLNAQPSTSSEPMLKAAPASVVPVHAEGHHGLPQAAVHVFRFGPLVITNSMIAVWIVALGIIIFVQMATRDMKLVPQGLQNFTEWLVEGLYNFLEEMLGRDLVKKTFWFFATIFIFILFTNWFGLIPGVGTLGWNVTLANGAHEFHPWMRGGNADLNMTSAMSLIFFFLWIIWAFQALGFVGFFKHIFGGASGTSGIMGLFIGAIFIFVGLIEVISILFRPVSLSFRLYGNVFAGENILEAMMNIVPWLGWILPTPFYFLELLVGLVQALVFTLLTAVFTALMCVHEDHGPSHGDKEHAKAH